MQRIVTTKTSHPSKNSPSVVTYLNFLRSSTRLAHTDPERQRCRSTSAVVVFVEPVRIAAIASPRFVA